MEGSIDEECVNFLTSRVLASTANQLNKWRKTSRTVSRKSMNLQVIFHIAPDKSASLKIIFFSFQPKHDCVLGTPKKRLNETIL